MDISTIELSVIHHSMHGKLILAHTSYAQGCNLLRLTPAEPSICAPQSPPNTHFFVRCVGDTIVCFSEACGSVYTTVNDGNTGVSMNAY
jgi:hypothetical protein